MPLILCKGVTWDRMDLQFVKDIKELFDSTKDTWYGTFTYRSYATQAKLYNDYLRTGLNRAAPPGKSAHNYGMAIDVVLDIDPKKPGLQPSWNTGLKSWLWLFAKVKMHPRLKSGITFGDGGHIERYKWWRYIDKDNIYDPIAVA